MFGGPRVWPPNASQSRQIRLYVARLANSSHVLLCAVCSGHKKFCPVAAVLGIAVVPSLTPYQLQLRLGRVYA